MIEPWTVLGERPRTDGWLPITTRTYRMPDGSVSDWDIHTPAFTTVAVLARTCAGSPAKGAAPTWTSSTSPWIAPVCSDLSARHFA